MIKKILVTALFITTVSIAAETPKYGYVTDSIRHNPMIEKSNLYFKIPSGERLEIIEVGDGWTKVKYGTTEGWMISRYIMNDVTSNEKLKQLENENKLLAKMNKHLGKKNKEFREYIQEKNKKAVLSVSEGYKLYGEDMEEHRLKSKEFDLLVKKIYRLKELLENEYRKLKEKVSDLQSLHNIFTYR